MALPKELLDKVVVTIDIHCPNCTGPIGKLRLEQIVIDDMKIRDISCPICKRPFFKLTPAAN